MGYKKNQNKTNNFGDIWNYALCLQSTPIAILNTQAA